MPSLRTRRSLDQEKVKASRSPPQRQAKTITKKKTVVAAGTSAAKATQDLEFKEGSIVWVNLGISFGWWPAEFQKVLEKPNEESSSSSLSSDLGLELKEAEPVSFSGITLASLLSSGKLAATVASDDHPISSSSTNGNPARTTRAANKGSGGKMSESPPETLSKLNTKEASSRRPQGPERQFLVRFFDDDKLELCRILSPDLILPYSCSRKVALIKEGLDRFVAGRDEIKKKQQQQQSGARNGRLIFDHRARQAQFYKDVEMAEVMTDNSMEVADILSQYHVIEGREEIMMDEEVMAKGPPKKRPKKSRRR